MKNGKYTESVQTGSEDPAIMLYTSGAIRITEKKLRALSDLTRLKIFLLLRNGKTVKVMQ